MANEALDTLERSQELIKKAQDQQTIFIIIAIILMLCAGWLYFYQMKKIERLEKEAREDRAAANADRRTLENQSSAERAEYLLTLKQMQTINEHQNDTLEKLRTGLEKVTESIKALDHKFDLLIVSESKKEEQ